MSHRYRVGELHGLETARKRGYVASIEHDDELALDWYGECQERSLPFVQCAFRRKYYRVDFELDPFLAGRPDLMGLSDDALETVRTIAAEACKASPNHKARASIDRTEGVIDGIPRDDAHRLAHRLSGLLRDMSMYQTKGATSCLI
jgi:hypothetical protein